MRYPNASPAASSWLQHKQQGRAYYESGEYEEALASYRAALNPELECPATEAQTLRSNVVACRLKLGGVAQAAAAVQDAKQCIAQNPAWAKGHVRLASAYIALEGVHSNDACNALQTALRLDPSNQLARQMLMRELRRDHTTNDTATPSAPLEEEDDDFVGSHEDTTGGAAFRQRPQPQDESPYQDQAPIDDSLSLRERIQFYSIQVRSWYQAQSEQFKVALRVMFVMLALYVAFGGRFGLEYAFSKTPTSRGNYGAGNAYDQYRQNYGASTNHHHHGHHDSSNSNVHRPRRTSSSSFQWSFDAGSLTSMIMMAGGVYLLYLNGVNPMHALWLANMFAGGQGRRRGFNRPMGGMGWGGGGGMRWGHGRRGRW